MNPSFLKLLQPEKQRNTTQIGSYSLLAHGRATSFAEIELVLLERNRDPIFRILEVDGLDQENVGREIRFPQSRFEREVMRYLGHDEAALERIKVGARFRIEMRKRHTGHYMPSLTWHDNGKDRPLW